MFLVNDSKTNEQLFVSDDFNEVADFVYRNDYTLMDNIGQWLQELALGYFEVIELLEVKIYFK